jgi:drug/metabolite transporter (DMT)-like permease
MRSDGQKQGIAAALSSALFLGVVPIFGKLAINSGFSPFTVIALRTTIAALLMMAVMYFKMRPFFYIYPVGLIGCGLAGVINGLGSVLYYTALSRLDASLGHMLYSLYPLFVALWLVIDRQPVTRLTLFRVGLALPAVFLLIGSSSQSVDLIGAAMMVGSAVLYSLHLLINQRILYEVPAPTVTLYTLLAMSCTVLIAFLLTRLAQPGSISAPAILINWWPVLAMAVITFSSRLTLFMGVKHLGGLQTAILGLAELFVTVLAARWWLGEILTLSQWLGAGLLMSSLVLIGFDKLTPQKRPSTGLLAWLNPPKVSPNDLPWSSHP